jgi:hypothetical protein
VINAQGGYALLERLGFKTEEGEMAKQKKVTDVKKAEAKESVVKSTKTEDAGLSRNQLMEEVRKRGIKNFRVMNKAELSEIVGGAKPARIETIQKGALTRWKAGWTKK